MKVNWSRRLGAGLGVVAGAVLLVAVAGSPAAASPLFTGGGRGLTVESAIFGAFDDARNTAQSVGFYGACTIVGEPAIFESTNDPNFGHIFRAQLDVTCER
jgi:hypothetical protein